VEAEGSCTSTPDIIEYKSCSSCCLLPVRPHDVGDLKAQDLAVCVLRFQELDLEVPGGEILMLVCFHGNGAFHMVAQIVGKSSMVSGVILFSQVQKTNLHYNIRVKGYSLPCRLFLYSPFFPENKNKVFITS